MEKPPGPPRSPTGASAETPDGFLGDDVYAIDTRLSGHPGVTSAYLVAGSAPCLVETGTATSAPQVEAALTALGIGHDDLATIVVTHIHLDHAGGVGHLAAVYPKAQIVVHRAGARHLVDPSRLMASARRVFGDVVIDRVFGDLHATADDRVRPLDHGDTVDLGHGRRLTALDSPGHARHHLGLLDSVTGDLYVGDAAGLWFNDTAEVRPATPPPEFDLAAALDSLRRFAAAAPTRLLFSHFGPADDPATTLAHAAEELQLWVDEVAALRGSGSPADLDHALEAVGSRDRARYAALRSDLDRATQIDQLSSTRANLAGVWRWLDNHPGPMGYGLPVE
ncbi:MAG: MBL fold metallo-hydrolase [Actinomycetes bacterium]